MLKSIATPYYPLSDKEYALPLYSQAKMLGIPVRLGQTKDGTHLGPSLIRNSSFITSMSSAGVNIEDCGDVEPLELNESEDSTMFGMKYPRSFIGTTLRIADKVHSTLKQNKNPSPNGRNAPLVLIGGDHSIATGTILGHYRAEPDACVIWVDAHADLNTPMTSSSGNMHGMPLAFLMNELQDEIPWTEEIGPIEPCLKAKDLVYIGLRDLDIHETYDIRKNNIPHFTMLDVDQLGIDVVIRQAIQTVNPRLERPIHLSIDIDSIDPLIAPSTGTAVQGGLTLREGLRICEEVSATGKLSVVELTELNPLIGTPEDVEKTKQAAVQLLKASLGYCRSGHLPVQVHSLSKVGILSRLDHMKSLNQNGNK